MIIVTIFLLFLFIAGPALSAPSDFSLLDAYNRHKQAHHDYKKALDGPKSPHLQQEEDYDLIDLARPGNFVKLGRVAARDWRVRPGPNSPHPDYLRKHSLMERVRTGQFRSRVVVV
ncbi:unnamed protein product [Caenorhabditis angaria]|uniref:Uncharacterized protein n=1 Tax=Caenorhabditis angaria TaxID=860376 RepID=A0A9P1N1Y5_9PELO|nr:unnamed protein product [Caenorhabditis angaria]